LDILEELQRRLGAIVIALQAPRPPMFEVWDAVVVSLDELLRDDRQPDEHLESWVCQLAEMIDSHYRNKHEGYDCDSNCHFCMKQAGVVANNCRCPVCKCVAKQFEEDGRTFDEAMAAVNALTPEWLPGAVIQQYERRSGKEYRYRSVVDFPPDQDQAQNQPQNAATTQPALPPHEEESQEDSIMADIAPNDKPIQFSLKPEHANMKIDPALAARLASGDATYAEVMETTAKVATERESFTKFDRHFECIALDGARALSIAIKEQFGHAEVKLHPFAAMFGDDAVSHSFEIAFNKFEEIPWGPLKLHGLDGMIATCASHPGADGNERLTLHINVRRKDMPRIDALVARIHELLKTGSVYKGKAIELDFNPIELVREGAPPVRRPKFIMTGMVRPEELVFSRHIETQIENYLRTPISMGIDALREDNIPRKRVVLLGGGHGTGKTCLLGTIGELCTTSGQTYIEIKSADHLLAAIQWSERLEAQDSGVVIVCEDVDPVVRGERTLKMNELLEAIDGVRAKKRNVTIVLTTNYPEAIHSGFIRTGRVNSYIRVEEPDAEAVGRLVQLYGRGMLDPNIDLNAIGEKLANAEYEVGDAHARDAHQPAPPSRNWVENVSSTP